MIETKKLGYFCSHVKVKKIKRGIADTSVLSAAKSQLIISGM